MSVVSDTEWWFFTRVQRVDEFSRTGRVATIPDEYKALVSRPGEIDATYDACFIKALADSGLHVGANDVIFHTPNASTLIISRPGAVRLSFALIASLFTALTFLYCSRILLDVRGIRRLHLGLCPRCAYPLNTTGDRKCVECGWSMSA
ncbi:MAG: hypothetical protein IPK69_10095 [Phycisphaerales bacterium]|nr:MAG: hypothetical protein IPK69_10095 [Phycisphaerales bacterium]